MKLLINTSTLTASGATQVSTSFIHECQNFNDNEYHILLSPTVEKQLNIKEFPDNFVFYTIENHPLYGLKGMASRKKIRELEKQIKPDVVFSVFGPSWWTPKAPHLQGYAYSHYVYPESPVFKLLSFSQNLKINLFKRIHLYFLNKNGDAYVSETEDINQRFQKVLRVPGKKFYTVSNTVSSFYQNYKDRKETLASKTLLLPPKHENEFRFLTLCTYHVHKNLGILNQVIPMINKKYPNNNIKFITTISEEEFKTHFDKEVQGSIYNLGRVPVQNCPQLYDECDAMFLPTLLECFSASYPEAMMMDRPIATSNLSFATDICGNAAIYFDPMNPLDISDKLFSIIESDDLRNRLIAEGRKKLGDFETAYTRAEKYLTICEEISRS